MVLTPDLAKKCNTVALLRIQIFNSDQLTSIIHINKETNTYRTLLSTKVLLILSGAACPYYPCSLFPFYDGQVTQERHGKRETRSLLMEINLSPWVFFIILPVFCSWFDGPKSTHNATNPRNCNVVLHSSIHCKKQQSWMFHFLFLLRVRIYSSMICRRSRKLLGPYQQERYLSRNRNSF